MKSANIDHNTQLYLLRAYDPNRSSARHLNHFMHATKSSITIIA